MDDGCAVGLVKRVGDFNGSPKPRLEWKRTLSETIRERLTVQVLHDQISGAVLLTHFVERANVGVIELRNNPGFAVEAFSELPVGRQDIWQDLDRDRPTKACVVRFVDLAHAARAEWSEDFIGA
jgi:hypothetical protein